MGLVDYSESDTSGSEAEGPPKTAPKVAQSSSKKPFQKVVDRSNPGKIVVNLPQASVEKTNSQSDEPPAKRPRTGGSGLFSGFNSFLPAPKNANKPKPAIAPQSSSSSSSRPGVNLKTSAAPGFSRDGGENSEFDTDKPSSGMVLPQPKAAQPSIPEGQKSEEDVKLVGKPLMFRPLSVARNAKKKKSTKISTVQPAASPSHFKGESNGTSVPAEQVNSPAAAPVAPKKVSLFSMHTEEPSEPAVPTEHNTVYEPLFAAQPATTEHDNSAYSDYAQYANEAQNGPAATTLPGSESLGSIADDLHLSAAERRELFGRGGSAQGAKRVINFNMDKEYEHNETIRAAGEQQIHNPVRAIQGGKHSLRQLVQNVHNQREALEDSFAKGKSNRKEASNKYGW